MPLLLSVRSAAAALLLLVAFGCGGDGGGSSPTAPLPTEALGRAAETHSAAASSTVYVVSTDTVLSLEEVDDLGTYDAPTGWWELTLPLRNGGSARLRLQWGNAQGSVQEHYSGATTTWVRLVGSTTASVGFVGSSERSDVEVTFDLTLSGIEASSNWVTIDGSGTTSALLGRTTFVVMHLGQVRSGLGFPGDGAMTVSLGAINAQLRFRSQQGVEGMYYDPYNLRYFSVDLTNGDIYRD